MHIISIPIRTISLESLVVLDFWCLSFLISEGSTILLYANNGGWRDVLDSKMGREIIQKEDFQGCP